MGALTEQWHPESNTFIFPTFEATILLEEVEILCGINKVRRGREMEIAIMPKSVKVHLVLAEFMPHAAIAKVLCEGGIHLQKLAEWTHNALKGARERRVDVEGIMKGYAICLAGAFLFPTKDNVMVEEQLSAVCAMWEGKAVGPAILAYLYSGITAASMGQPFYGSSFIFSCWVDLHFKFDPSSDPTLPASRLFSKSPLHQIIGIMGGGTKVSNRAPNLKIRIDWREHLRHLPLSMFTTVPHPLLRRPIRSRLTSGIDLHLIGAAEVVLYNPHRCLPQLGLPRTNFEGPSPLSPIRMRSLDDSESDDPAIVLAHWRVAKFEVPSGECEEGLDGVSAYVRGIRKLLP